MSDHDERTPEAVPETGPAADEITADAEAEFAEKGKVNIISLDEMKKRARDAVTDDSRIAIAKPYHIPPPIDCEVMVAPAMGSAFYDKIFDSGKRLFGDVDDKNGLEDIDRSFVLMVVKDCVVDPKLDDEIMNLLIEANPVAFHSLVNFCVNITMVGTMSNIGERLGAIDTEAMHVFFAGIGGSGSTPMQP